MLSAVDYYEITEIAGQSCLSMLCCTSDADYRYLYVLQVLRCWSGAQVQLPRCAASVLTRQTTKWKRSILHFVLLYLGVQRYNGIIGNGHQCKQ